MLRTLGIVAGVSFIIAALCFAGAAALVGPEIARSEFWRSIDWEHFDWEDSDISTDAPAITQTRELSGFSNVSVGGGIRAELSVGPDFLVEVIGAEPDMIVTDVLGSRLSIEPARSRGWWRNRRRALVRVSMPAIEGIGASAGAHVIAEGVAADVLDLDASAGARLEARGTCQVLDVEASSGASIDARGLICDRGEADMSSGGSAHIHVTGRLDVEASSGGSVHAEGDPQIGALSLSSGGSLDRD